MNYLKQLIEHNPAKGQWGDCDRAALACLLDKEDVTEVPHFFDQCCTEYDYDKAHDIRRIWIEKQGKTLIRLAYNGVHSAKDVVAATSHNNRGLAFILVGKSPRHNVGHVVICRDNFCIWDPSPDVSMKMPKKVEEVILGPEPSTGMFIVEFVV